MRPLPAHSLAAAVALAFFVFAKSLLMRNARSKTLLFFSRSPEANRIRTQSGVIISLLEYLILNHKGIAKITSTNADRSAIFRRPGTCACGQTASSCRLAWKTTANACWCAGPDRRDGSVDA